MEETVEKPQPREERPNRSDPVVMRIDDQGESEERPQHRSEERENQGRILDDQNGRPGSQ
jgi:hypothetical protein